MRKYLFVCAGGFLGAISRYMLKALPVFEHTGRFPLSTLLINVSGSFLLCLLLTFALNSANFDPDLRLGLGTGFIGAFTTFSTLCKETVTLLKGGNLSLAVLYIAASTALGLFAAYLGYLTALTFSKKRAPRTNETDDSLESDVD